MKHVINATNARVSRFTWPTLALLSVVALLLSCGQDATAPVPLVATQPSAAANVAAVGVDGTATSAASSALTEQAHLSGTTGAGSARNTSGWAGSSFGNFNLSPAPQTTLNGVEPAQRWLTVASVGSATRAADEAYIVMIPQHRYGVSGPEQLSEDDRDDIVQRLAELDIPEEDIEFDYRSRYGEPTISVAIEPRDIADQHEEILDAVKEVVRSFDAHGLRFALTETSCQMVLSKARREAVPAAEKTAGDLAEALGAQLDEVIGAEEEGVGNYANLSRTGADFDACADRSTSAYYDLLPFETEPEIKVFVNMRITYGISAPTNPSDTSQQPQG